MKVTCRCFLQREAGRKHELELAAKRLRVAPHIEARMPDGVRIAIPLLEEALCLRHEWRSPATRTAAGFVIVILTKEYDTALCAIERALSLNASCALALYLGPLANALADRPSGATSQPRLRLGPTNCRTSASSLSTSGTAAGRAHRRLARAPPLGAPERLAAVAAAPRERWEVAAAARERREAAAAARERREVAPAARERREAAAAARERPAVVAPARERPATEAPADARPAAMTAGA
jgi:hypothetical protein